MFFNFNNLKVVKSGSGFRFDHFRKVVKSAVVRDLTTTRGVQNRFWTTFEKLSNLVLILDLDNFRKVVKSDSLLILPPLLSPISHPSLVSPQIIYYPS